MSLHQLNENSFAVVEGDKVIGVVIRYGVLGKDRFFTAPGTPGNYFDSQEEAIASLEG